MKTEFKPMMELTTPEQRRKLRLKTAKLRLDFLKKIELAHLQAAVPEIGCGDA